MSDFQNQLKDNIERNKNKGQVSIDEIFEKIIYKNILDDVIKATKFIVDDIKEKLRNNKTKDGVITGKSGTCSTSILVNKDTSSFGYYYGVEIDEYSEIVGEDGQIIKQFPKRYTSKKYPIDLFLEDRGWRAYEDSCYFYYFTAQIINGPSGKFFNKLKVKNASEDVRVSTFLSESIRVAVMNYIHIEEEKESLEVNIEWGDSIYYDHTDSSMLYNISYTYKLEPNKPLKMNIDELIVPDNDEIKKEVEKNKFIYLQEDDDEDEYEYGEDIE